MNSSTLMGMDQHPPKLGLGLTLGLIYGRIDFVFDPPPKKRVKKKVFFFLECFLETWVKYQRKNVSQELGDFKIEGR